MTSGSSIASRYFQFHRHNDLTVSEKPLNSIVLIKKAVITAGNHKEPASKKDGKSWRWKVDWNRQREHVRSVYSSFK